MQRVCKEGDGRCYSVEYKDEDELLEVGRVI